MHKLKLHFVLDSSSVPQEFDALSDLDETPAGILRSAGYRTPLSCVMDDVNLDPLLSFRENFSILNVPLPPRLTVVCSQAIPRETTSQQRSECSVRDSSPMSHPPP